MPKPGDSITTEFITEASTGAATNADSLPTAILARNGSDDGAVTVTVTNIDAGRYKAALTIPGGYSSGDNLGLIASYAVSAVAKKQKVWEAQLDTQQALFKTKGAIWVVDPVNGNDSTGNGSWAAPFATPLPTTVGGAHQANAGDLVFILPGICAIGNNFYQVPTGVAVQGSGEFKTIVTGTYSAFGNDKGTFYCSGNNTISDLTVQTVSADGVFQLPITDAPGCTSILIERVRVQGITDCLYFWYATDVLVRHCQLICNWDCLYAANVGTTVMIEDSTLTTHAHNITSLPNNNSTVQCVDGASVTIVRSSLSNVAIDTNPNRITRMIHAEHASAVGAMITLAESSAYLSVDGATQLNLVADAGCSIVDGGAAYDRTKTGGTIYSLPLFSNTPATGPGPFPMTVHVQDGNGVAITGARVTINGTGNSGWNTTDGSGNASLSLAAGSVTISASATGYSAFVPVTDTINSSGQWTSDSSSSRTIVLTAISFSTPSPGQTEVYLTTRDQTGTAKSGVVVQFQITAPPAGESGNAYDTTIKQVASDVNGIVQTALPIGASFQYWTIKGVMNSDVVPTSGPYALKDLVGGYTA